MPPKLIVRQYIPLPPHPAGDFDHGDVYLANGRVFVANTAAGTVEVLGGEQLQHFATIPGCPEASGVLCAQQEGLVFAVARATGKLLVIDAISATVLREMVVGFRPNGLAWDSQRRHLLVADVQDNRARFVDPQAGQILATIDLPGRPRWAVYRQAGDDFLVNIREPPCVVALSAETLAVAGRFQISLAGPHGLALDQEDKRAFVTCDGGAVVALDLATGQELAQAPVVGVPDVIWHNHRLNRLYVASVAAGQSGVIAVVDTVTMTIAEQFTTEAGTHTTTYDAQRQRLYVFLTSCQAAMYEESEVG